MWCIASYDHMIFEEVTVRVKKVLGVNKSGGCSGQ